MRREWLPGSGRVYMLGVNTQMVLGLRPAAAARSRYSAGMEVIVTHNSADFDALASAVAAQKLYPSASIVLGRSLGRDVRGYLALHRDRYPTLEASALDARVVRRAIIVDVRRASRLAHVAELRDRILARDPALEVHVWDHHAAAPDDISAALEHCEPVGSATTLFVEQIQRMKLTVDVMEATLFALGIHVDTGSFRYGGTTARDAAAFAWLLDHGARLAVINRYAGLPFTDSQLRALSAVLAALRIEHIGGARIGVATLPDGVATDGLGEVASEALALEDVHALFTCFPLRDGKVQVVARSRVSWIDVGTLLQQVGGGGHATAAAATVRGRDALTITEELLTTLRACSPRAARVRDVMLSPVQRVYATSC